MPKLSAAQVSAIKREEIISLLTDFFAQRGEDVLRESGNGIAFPIIDGNGEEKFVKITIAIPRGSRIDGESYDGYAMAEDYRQKQEEQIAKKAEKEKEKQAKIEKQKLQLEERKRKKEAEQAKRAQ